MPITHGVRRACVGGLAYGIRHTPPTQKGTMHNERRHLGNVEWHFYNAKWHMENSKWHSGYAE